MAGSGLRVFPGLITFLEQPGGASRPFSRDRSDASELGVVIDFGRQEEE